MVLIFVQNTILSLIVTSITFAVLFLLNYLNKKNLITTEVSRKVVHIGAGTLYLAIYFYNDHGYFSKYLNIFPNLFWTGILIWKSQHHSSVHQQYDLVVSTITRNHRGSELLRGPLFFNFVMIICGSVLYKTTLGSIIMGILTWGDGLAAVIGVRYGTQRKIYGSKTLDGLLAMFFTGIIASIVYISLLVDFQAVHLFKIIVISFITAIIETLTPSDFDNLTIPLCIIFIYFFIY
jgi:dolichol kinase